MPLKKTEKLIEFESTKPNYWANIPGAIIIGSILISISILFSGGVIKLKNSNTLGATATQTPPTTGDNGPTAADPGSLRTKLADLAGSISLDKNKFLSCLDSQKYKDEISQDESDAQSAGISGTPGFILGKSSSDGKIDGVKITGAYPYATFKNVIDKLIASTPIDQIKGSEDGVETGSTTTDNDPVLGENSAPITIVEFSDYECPFCKRHFQQTLPSLEKDYIQTGKVKLVFRDFIAVSAHNPAATTEALGAECVKELGGDSAYYKYHDLVYSKTSSNGSGVQ